MADITVEQARERQVCRVCGLPIHYPSLPGVWWEHEDWPLRQGEGMASKNETEFAHSACLADGHPFGQA